MQQGRARDLLITVLEEEGVGVVFVRGSMQMLNELLKGVDDKVRGLLYFPYVCRHASLGTIVYSLT